MEMDSHVRAQPRSRVNFCSVFSFISLLLPHDRVFEANLNAFIEKNLHFPIRTVRKSAEGTDARRLCVKPYFRLWLDYYQFRVDQLHYKMLDYNLWLLTQKFLTFVRGYIMSFPVNNANVMLRRFSQSHKKIATLLIIMDDFNKKQTFGKKWWVKP